MAEATLASIADHPLYSIDPELLETAAAGFEAMGSSVRDNGAAVVSAWTPLSAHYSGPGDAELFSTMTPVGTTSTSVGDNFDAVATALRTFKTTADEVKASMDQLKLDHAALKHSIDTFEPTIEDGPMSYDAKSTLNWYDDENLRAENTRIIQELSNCLEKMHEAERTCANTIRGLHGLPALTAGDGGYTSGQYGVDEIADEAETPWGTAAFDDESCGESAWNTTVGLGQDVLGLAGLIGMKWDWDNGGAWSWNGENAEETWSGFGALIGRDPETGEFGLDTAGETWLGMGKDFLAWDRWGENPNAAFGQVFVNGVSSIGVVGIIGKISRGGKVASLGRHGDSHHDGSSPEVDVNRADSYNPDELTPDFDDIDFDLEIDKILDSDTDYDTSGPHHEADVPPVRDAGATPGDTNVPVNTESPGGADVSGNTNGVDDDGWGNADTPSELQPDLENPGGRDAPYEPIIGSTDGGPGTWQESPRTADSAGMPNQVERSGVLPTPDGKIVEYYVDRPGGGRPVEFDNFTHRGQPPVEIFQEFKGDYSFALKPYISEARRTEIIDGMVTQARGQLDAIPSGARLEWYFETPGVADLARAAFARADLADLVDIYVVP